MNLCFHVAGGAVSYWGSEEGRRSQQEESIPLLMNQQCWQDRSLALLMLVQSQSMIALQWESRHIFPGIFADERSSLMI